MAQKPTRRVYVDVVVTYDKYGFITPNSITYEDARKYAINKVLQVRRLDNLQTGGTIVKYVIQINKQVTSLYFDGRWYVEGKY